MWLEFLEHPSVYCRPFMDFQDWIVADEVNFYTDASGKIGFGGICEMDWMHQKWDPLFIRKFRPSIEYLELYALVAGIIQWIDRFRNRRVILFCDNKRVRDMVNGSSSSCKQCMVLLRILVLESMKYNVRVFIKYVKSCENYWADMLSRDQMSKFHRERGNCFTEKATPIPESISIWPVSKIWKC